MQWLFQTTKLLGTHWARNSGLLTLRLGTLLYPRLSWAECAPPPSSYAESLNLSTPDCEVLGNRVFKEVIEFKRGH